MASSSSNNDGKFKSLIANPNLTEAEYNEMFNLGESYHKELTTLTAKAEKTEAENARLKEIDGWITTMTARSDVATNATGAYVFKETNVSSWADDEDGKIDHGIITVGGTKIRLSKVSEITSDISSDEGSMVKSSACLGETQLKGAVSRFRQALAKRFPDMDALNEDLWEQIIVPILIAFAIVGTSTKASYTKEQRIVIKAGPGGKKKYYISVAAMHGLIKAAADDNVAKNPVRKFLRAWSEVAINAFKNIADSGPFEHLGGKWAVPRDYDYLAADYLDSTANMDDTEREILRQKTREAVSQTRAAGDVAITSTSQLGRRGMSSG